MVSFPVPCNTIASQVYNTNGWDFSHIPTQTLAQWLDDLLWVGSINLCCQRYWQMVSPNPCNTHISLICQRDSKLQTWCHPFVPVYPGTDTLTSKPDLFRIWKPKHHPCLAPVPRDCGYAYPSFFKVDKHSITNVLSLGQDQLFHTPVFIAAYIDTHADIPIASCQVSVSKRYGLHPFHWNRYTGCI